MIDDILVKDEPFSMQHYFNTQLYYLDIEEDNIQEQLRKIKFKKAIFKTRMALTELFLKIQD